MSALYILFAGWSDIGYNFVVGEDGNVYEGRGWNSVGAHTYGYNNRSIGKWTPAPAPPPSPTSVLDGRL